MVGKWVAKKIEPKEMLDTRAVGGELLKRGLVLVSLSFYKTFNV